MSKDTEKERANSKENMNQRLENIEESIEKNPGGLRPRVINLETQTETILRRLETIGSRQWKILIMIVASLIAILSSLFTTVL